MGLEWRTLEDEEGRVREEAPEVEARAPQRPGRKRWLSVLIALLLVAVVILTVRYVLLERLDAFAATVEADVLSMHDIVEQAERDLDGALFGSMISPDYPNWGRTQKEMLLSGARWDRPYFDLTLDSGPDDKPPTGTVEDITFTSDWRMATVTLAFPYVRPDGSPVTLHQIVTYRDEATGWALVPPYPSFWGETQTFTGRYLTVEYPTRDAATVEQLAPEWDKMLAAVCQELEGIRCRRTWKLEVELSTESSPLARMADLTSRGPLWKGMSHASPTNRGAGGSELKLPTPSLIGSPVDEAGFQAVRAGYAPLIVGAAAADIVGWRCCEKIVFFHALLDKQLSRLGLKPWPLTASDYEDILQGSIHDVTGLHWVYLQRSYNNVTPQIQKIVYSIVDLILASNPEHSPASLQRLLLRYDTYRPWLSNALPIDRDHARQGNYGRWIQKEWIHYADQQLETAAAPGTALPEQDLQLLCTTERFNGAHLYRYDLQRDEFIEENSDGPFRRMYSLPDDAGVLLQRLDDRDARTRGSRIQIWRQGQTQDVTSEAGYVALYPVQTFADGMLLFTYDARRRPPIRFNFLDQAECDGGVCVLRSLDGLPAWSPDRERTVVLRGDGLLWLGDGAGEPQMTVARGRSAAWLDNSRFAFIQPDDDMQVAVMSLPNSEFSTLLETERLIDALQNATDATRVTRIALAAHPTMPDRLFLGARVGNGAGKEATHVFVYNLATDEITELLQVDHPLEPYRSMRFSVDGRWLFVHSVGERARGWHLYLYNIRTGDTLTYSSDTALAFPGYDLSADGAWLVRVDEGYIHLIPLNGGRQRLVAHDFAHCYAAVWVNKSIP
ncbi:MAG: hypothetical protein OXI80_00240 [Caldilineaceae bacterium]|nr:hypothetical protein [Caldilineaceae bacterium]MDE0336070.1 hypothetical protein [Caldilineaceae bacterium]